MLLESDYWEVTKTWPGETVAILAGGSSLTQAQVDRVLDGCRTIAINRAGLKGPRKGTADWITASRADWLWACDADRFWAWHPEAVEFPGRKIVVRGCGPLAPAYWRQLAELRAKDVDVIRHSSREYPCTARHEGASPDPAIVRGDNSTFQILSVIAHTGVRTVLLLGLDMKGNHWHNGYRDIGAPDYSLMAPRFRSLTDPLARAGVAVFNCSLNSAVDAFPKVRLEDVL